MSLRLARFNVSALNHSQFKPNHNFFMGVPAPCGALLIIMPMILDFDFTSIINWNIRSHTTYINIYIAIISLLLVSRAPTISSKASIKPQYISLSMVIFTIFVVSMVLYPWYTLPILAVGYILSIPICAILINRRISD
jgi:CDP-diacylglycerol--serine O-phosphatidyltransferase